MNHGLFAAILLGVIGPEVFIVQPGFVQGLVQQLGFDEQAAGYTASAEMFGIAATTVLLTFAAHRWNWRSVIVVSLLTMFAANVACTFVADRDVFVALRFLAGLGAGGVVSLSFAAIGLTAAPDRNFGWLIMWVLTYGALGLLAMPSVFATVGMNGVLWFFALFPLIGLPVVHHLPAGGDQAVQVEQDAVDLPFGLRCLALAAMLAYFLAQGAVWAYLFLIGLSGGLGEQQVANGLTLSQFAGIAGALAAALLARRASRAHALALGIAGGALVLFALFGHFGVLLYAFTVTVYNLAWNFTHPFLLGSMASFDRRGRVVVHAVAMQMVGLAAGPGLAASVIDGGGFGAVIVLGIALFAASLALILPPVIVQGRFFRASGATPASR